MFSLISRFILVAGLVTCYVLAHVLPIRTGWENGLIENTQVALLLLGVLMAVCSAARAQNKRLRWFWIMLVPIWFLLVARELSWGTAILMPPLYVHPETGPIYSSTLQLWYRPAVAPVMVLLLLGMVVIFFVTRQYRTVVQLFQQHLIPWFEIALAVIAALLCASAEGHGLSIFQALSHPQQQVLEELFEFWMYASVFVGQWLLIRKMKANQAMHSQ